MDHTHIKGYTPVIATETEKEKKHYYDKRHEKYLEARQKNPFSTQKTPNQSSGKKTTTERTFPNRSSSMIPKSSSSQENNEPDYFTDIPEKKKRPLLDTTLIPKKKRKDEPVRALAPEEKSSKYLTPEEAARFVADKPYAISSNEILESTVRIETQTQIFDYNEAIKPPSIQPHTGSGSYIQHRNKQGSIDDRIITNAHVVADAALITVLSHANRCRYAAVVEHVCPEADIAILWVVDDPKKPYFFEKIKPLKICETPWNYLKSSQYTPVTTHGYSLANDYTKTEGHITNVELQYYANSLQHLPAFRTDAAISGGNSGGPATVMAPYQSEMIPQIIGVVFQSQSSGQNVNSVIPVQLMTKVIEDRLKPPHERGIPHLSIVYDKIQNPYLRNHFNIKNNQGVIVTLVPPLSAFNGYVQKGDMLLEINGYAISERATIDYDERKNLSWVFEYALRNLNESVRFKIAREHQELEIEVPLSKRFMEESKVRRFPQNKTPTYFIASGIVFSIYQMGGFDLREEDAAFSIAQDMLMRDNNLKKKSTDELVKVAAILPHRFTESYGAFEGDELVSVNGTAINNIVELVKTVDAVAPGDMLIFELKDTRKKISTIALPQMSEKEILQLMEKYHVFADRSVHLEEGHINDYFDYQSFDGIRFPSEYQEIFNRKGPFEALLSNQRSLLSITDLADEENQEAEEGHELTQEEIDTTLSRGANDAIYFLKDIFNTNEIVFLLTRAADRGHNLPETSSYLQTLDHLNKAAITHKHLWNRWRSGGLTQKKSQQDLLISAEDKIRQALSKLEGQPDPQFPNEPSLREIMAYFMIPLTITDDDLEALHSEPNNNEEEESTVLDKEISSGSEILSDDEEEDNDEEILSSEKSSSDSDDARSLEDFIEEENEINEDTTKILKDILAKTKSRKKISFSAPLSCATSDKKRSKTYSEAGEFAELPLTRSRKKKERESLNSQKPAETAVLFSLSSSSKNMAHSTTKKRHLS